MHDLSKLMTEPNETRAKRWLGSYLEQFKAKNNVQCGQTGSFNCAARGLFRVKIFSSVL